FLFGIFSLATLASTSSSVVSEPRLLHAYRTATPILVDGKGDDEAWQHAQRDTRFTERVPNLGSTPPVDTSVQVAYDDVSLYVIIQGTINGDEAIIRSLRRDSFQIFSDDTVS